MSEIAPAQIYWPGITPHDPALDIVDAVSAAAAVVEVAANYLARHARGHDLCSTADHYDVSGTPGDEDLLIYDGSTWSPAPAPAPAAQTIWTRRLLMMGM